MHIFFYIESQSHSISLIHSDPRNIEIKVTSNSTHCHIIYEASLFHFLFWTEISKFQMWPGISPQHFLLLLLLCLNPSTAPGIPSCENSLLPLLAIQVQLWPKVRLNVVIIMELVIFPQVAFFLSSWFSLLSLLSSSICPMWSLFLPSSGSCTAVPHLHRAGVHHALNSASGPNQTHTALAILTLHRDDC